MNLINPGKQLKPDFKKFPLHIYENAFEIEFIFGSDSIKITKYVGTDEEVQIPSKMWGLAVGGLTVTVIGKDAFCFSDHPYEDIDATPITSVIIPDTVTNIEDRAFANNQLTRVVIPDSVTYIGKRAFFENGLTSVTIPDNVSIDDGAFMYNDATLTRITIGSNVRLSRFVSVFTGFDAFYRGNGGIPGTYHRDDDGMWRMR